MTLKEAIKIVVPESWISLYHKTLAYVAAVVYRHPSKKMLVIGITGTKGKSSTCNMIWKILTDQGHTVGLTSTLNYRIGKQINMPSPYKMSMLGRFKLQKWLRQMVKAGCDVAIVETTSEGIKQWRHIGIAYDIAAFTNLTPEHIEAHGGFEQYKQAKLELFWYMTRLKQKQLNGKLIPKVSVVNMDSDYAEQFLSIGTEDGTHQKIRVGSSANNEIVVDHITEARNNTTCTVNTLPATIPLLGAWNVSNVGVAFGVGHALHIPLPDMIKSMSSMEQIPGRMEFIDAGQPFTVIVDYAHEPRSLELLYRFWRKQLTAGQQLITLISSTGGGRDKGRRIKNGETAALFCDYVIVTDEDPYDEDPQAIMDEVAKGAREKGMIEGKTMWTIIKRREGIAKAFALARPGDVVILPAKGAEQSMIVAGGKKIPWDDRVIAREELAQYAKKG